jgi:hypothetical protein
MCLFVPLYRPFRVCLKWVIPCSSVSHDLDPSLVRYIGPSRLDAKLFWAMLHLDRVFFFLFRTNLLECTPLATVLEWRGVVLPAAICEKFGHEPKYQHSPTQSELPLWNSHSLGSHSPVLMPRFNFWTPDLAIPTHAPEQLSTHSGVASNPSAAAWRVNAWSTRGAAPPGNRMDAADPLCAITSPARLLPRTLGPTPSKVRGALLEAIALARSRVRALALWGMIPRLESPPRVLGVAWQGGPSR